MPNPWVMILLEEAIARFNRAAHPYGTGVSTWRRVNKPGRLLAEIEQEIAPLTIPVELRAFWHRYNPGSINPPALEGFIPLDLSLIHISEPTRPY